MAYQVRNIIVGAAALYLGVQDSTYNNYTAPTLPTVPAGAGNTQATALEGAAATWRHVGYTTEGLELAYEPDYTDVEVDQLLDAAKIFKSGMRVSLNTTLVEASLENLLIAWGLPGAGAPSPHLASTATEETLSIGSGALGDEPVERSLAAVGPGPRSGAGAKRERVYLARRVISVEASTVALRRTEASTFPVSFRLLPDPNFAKSEYGLIRDRVIT